MRGGEEKEREGRGTKGRHRSGDGAPWRRYGAVLLQLVLLAFLPADVCLNGPAKQARQLALMLRGHPAGASSRHLITGARRGGRRRCMERSLTSQGG